MQIKDIDEVLNLFKISKVREKFPLLEWIIKLFKIAVLRSQKLHPSRLYLWNIPVELYKLIWAIYFTVYAKNQYKKYIHSINAITSYSFIVVILPLLTEEVCGLPLLSKTRLLYWSAVFMLRVYTFFVSYSSVLYALSNFLYVLYVWRY